jgi:ferrous iron transport protein A
LWQCIAAQEGYCEPVAISWAIWQRRGMTLDILPIGQRARIVAVDWSALVEEEAARLQALGLDEGARVAVSHRGVFGGADPIAIMVGRMSVAVRRAHARAMQVEAV